ncbi:MAG TPA: hypothetical protein VGI79_10010 [Caulobacteraceae bacterium]|jgi:hypothetical protein
MRSNLIERWRHFRSDVDREIIFLITRHGDQAYRAALAAAARPNLRTRRRKVLKAAARALNPAPRLFGIFRLPRRKAPRPPAPKGDARSAAS